MRAKDDGTGYALPVEGVFVTYTKPELGSDAAGFFVQADQAGPAIFVAVDPTTLTPPAHIGDKVSFTAVDLVSPGSLKTVSTISGFTVVSTGNPIAPLVTEVSNSADLVSALTTYESRAIRLTGSLSANFVAAGTPQVATPIATLGLTDANLRLRMPEAIRAQYDLGAGCSLTANYGVMWRFNAVAQPSVYSASSLTGMTCAAPTVVGAVPSSATELVVTFDRKLDPATVDATDFSFDNGLVASAVAVNGAAVTVTTNAETPGTTYTVTVSNLADMLGAAIGTPNTAMFTGYTTTAKLLINEINPNITGSHDLIELLVTQAGTTNGFVLTQIGSSTETLATLPDLNVAAGDIIVVHLTPAGTTGIAPATETTAKNQYANATYSANYDGAWDVLGNAIGLSFGNRVIEVTAPGPAILDAVPFVVSNAGSPLQAFPGVLQGIQLAGLWLPADCGGVACTYTSTPTAVAISVDYLSTGTTATGNSVSRKPGMNTMQKSDWNAAGAQSFGLVNP